MELSKLSENLYQKLLSNKTKEKSEKVILWIALGSFIIHLTIIGLIYFDIISINEPSNLLKNPIAAIYTPFSFILVYEVYLLIYFLPKFLQVVQLAICGRHQPAFLHLLFPIRLLRLFKQLLIL